MKKQTNAHQLEKLYETYEQRVYRVAYKVLRSVEQAEDATQETFIQLYQAMDRWCLLSEDDKRRYVLRVAKNKAIDYYRKNQKQVDVLSNYQKRCIVVEDNVETKVSEWVSEEQVDVLLSVLPESYQQVFMYRVFYGLSSKEVAKLTGLSEVNVRKQYERAKKKIIAVIGGAENDSIRETLKGIS